MSLNIVILSQITQNYVFLRKITKLMSSVPATVFLDYFMDFKLFYLDEKNFGSFFVPLPKNQKKFFLDALKIYASLVRK
jgi:hypothetical protein